MTLSGPWCYCAREGCEDRSLGVRAYLHHWGAHPSGLQLDQQGTRFSEVRPNRIWGRLALALYSNLSRWKTLHLYCMQQRSINNNKNAEPGISAPSYSFSWIVSLSLHFVFFVFVFFPSVLLQQPVINMNILQVLGLLQLLAGTAFSVSLTEILIDRVIA